MSFFSLPQIRLGLAFFFLPNVTATGWASAASTGLPLLFSPEV
jgi:hypothetical protein